MGLSELTGTPWHVDKYHREEGDNVRHKSKCRYYYKGECRKLGFRCYGSAHCEHYIETIYSNVDYQKNNVSPKKATLIVNRRTTICHTCHNKFDYNIDVDLVNCPHCNESYQVSNKILPYDPNHKGPRYNIGKNWYNIINADTGEILATVKEDFVLKQKMAKYNKKGINIKIELTYKKK